MLYTDLQMFQIFLWWRTGWEIFQSTDNVNWRDSTFC